MTNDDVLYGGKSRCGSTCSLVDIVEPTQNRSGRGSRPEGRADSGKSFARVWRKMRSSSTKLACTGAVVVFRLNVTDASSIIVDPVA